MSDVRCAKCGEPWDHYGITHGDMSASESVRFLRGEGCPCCRFGTICPSCNGAGRETGQFGPSCGTCRDRGYVLAWTPKANARQYKVDHFYTGYVPNVRKVKDPGFDEPLHMGTRIFPERIGQHETADGWVEEWWIACPDCPPDVAHLPCVRCAGSGELVADPEDELEAAREECDASDGEPMAILERRGVI